MMSMFDIIIRCIEWCVGISIGAVCGIIVLGIEVSICKCMYNLLFSKKKEDKKKGS